jgi:hypothetical protein
MERRKALLTASLKADAFISAVQKHVSSIECNCDCWDGLVCT